MVNNIKIVLYGVLLAFSFLLWQAWHKNSIKHEKATISQEVNHKSKISDLPTAPAHQEVIKTTTKDSGPATITALNNGSLG